MKPFEILTPSTLEEARSALVERDGDASIFAGGTDILGEMKQGTVEPACLVNISRIEVMRDVVSDSDETIIGSLVTLGEIARHSSIAERHPAFIQAVESVATPQIRNAGTLGGNLCQRPRCWYYRSPAFNCLKKGGDHCFAVDGGNKYRSRDLRGGTLPHRSPVGYGCRAYRTRRGGGDIRIRIGLRRGRSLARLAVAEPMSDNGYVRLASNLVARAVRTMSDCPRPRWPMWVRHRDAHRDSTSRARCRRSVYLKAKERHPSALRFDCRVAPRCQRGSGRHYRSPSGMFPVRKSAVPCWMDIDTDGVIRDARIAMGGVAPVPYFA